MDLVEVDVVGAEAAQAVLDLPPQPRRRRVRKHPSLVPFQSSLRSDEKRIATAMRTHDLADDLLGAALGHRWAPCR